MVASCMRTSGLLPLYQEVVLHGEQYHELLHEIQ